MVANRQAPALLETLDYPEKELVTDKHSSFFNSNVNDEERGRLITSTRGQHH
jgi:hypothetical protein